MCIFPTVEHCCMGVSLRVGMLFISVLAIMTGSLALTLMQQNSDYVHYAVPTPLRLKSYESSKVQYPFTVYKVHEPSFLSPVQILTNAEKKTYTLLAILSVLCYMAILWMVMGWVLLIASLMGEECLVYLFVVGMFLLVIFGLFLAGLAGYECISEGNPKTGHGCMYEEDACLVRSMDWLTGAACMMFYIIYLFLWMYFVIVANSFALNGDTL